MVETEDNDTLRRFVLRARRVQAHSMVQDWDNLLRHAGGSFDGLRDEVVDDPGEPATLGAQISNPGYPTLTSGGQVFSAGVTVEVEL